MLRLTSLANKYQRRTLRPLYAQTQAYPYDAQLVSTFDRSAATYDLGTTTAAIIPGVVAAKSVGETVTVADNTANLRPFGLFANFVGGELSDIPSDFDRVGVWRGAGGVFELLAPAFDDTGLAALAAADTGADDATEVYMTPSATGRLVGGAGANTYSDTARLIRRLSANAIIVELLV
jgi:hypothetical protein